MVCWVYMELLLKLILIGVIANPYAGNAPSQASPLVLRINSYVTENYQSGVSNEYILVSVPTQTLYVVENSEVTAAYKISTAKEGVGNTIGSHQTPLGLHTIIKKIGDGSDLGTIIKQGVATALKADIITEPISIDTDLLTTRVLWLAGTEDGINKNQDVDSLSRGIMIHGTPEEGLIGTPASHGCIRLANKDVVELFGQISTGTSVIIENEF